MKYIKERELTGSLLLDQKAFLLNNMDWTKIQFQYVIESDTPKIFPPWGRMIVISCMRIIKHDLYYIINPQSIFHSTLLHTDIMLFQKDGVIEQLP